MRHGGLNQDKNYACGLYIFLAVSEKCARLHFKIVGVNICNLFKNILRQRLKCQWGFSLFTELQNLRIKSFRILVESKFAYLKYDLLCRIQIQTECKQSSLTLEA